MKNIDELIHGFQVELEKNFGVRNGLLKISLTHELYNTVIYNYVNRGPYGGKFQFSDVNKPSILGVEIEARRREDL